ncbi:MAG: hypothetical protein F4142_11395 [Nitrospira sp. SB0675_bin_23]|nr:hypothetical protein [Nitrospira sp. SB0675_bin_23]
MKRLLTTVVCIIALAFVIPVPDGFSAREKPGDRKVQRAQRAAEKAISYWTKKGEDSQVERWTEISDAIKKGYVSDELIEWAREYGRRLWADGPPRILKLWKKIGRTLNNLHKLSSPPSWMGNDPWGPWNDLPFEMRRSVHHGIPSLNDLVVTSHENSSSYMTASADGAGNVLDSESLRNWAAGNPNASATWTGKVRGIINPKHTGWSDPRISFRYTFSTEKAVAGISYAVDHGNDVSKRYTLDTWSNLDFSESEFSTWSGDLTGKFYDKAPGNVPNAYIIGTVSRPHIVGTYRAQRPDDPR